MYNGKHFNQAAYALLRGFNDGTRSELRFTPIVPDKNGVITAVPYKEGSWQIGFEWDEPRDIRGVTVTFAEGSAMPAADAQYVQYWRKSWPTPYPDRRAGAYRGWYGVDDAFHGFWTEAYGEARDEGRTRTFLFDHIDINEAPDVFESFDFAAEFRRTLKLRAVFESETPPAISDIALIGSPIITEAVMEIYFGVTGKTGQNGGVSIWNGQITGISGAADAYALDNGRVSFQCRAGDSLTVHYVKNTGAYGGDRTIFDVATDSFSFGVAADDVESGVFMEDFDMLFTAPLNGAAAADRVSELCAGKRSIYDMVPEHEEQTTANAFREIPEMDVTKQPPYGRYVILGWGGVRQKFALRYNGDIFANKWLQKVTGRDTAKAKWAGASLHFRIASGNPPDFRERKDASRQYMPDAAVPVYVTEWLDRETEFTQTAFAALLDGPVSGPDEVVGDEDLAVMCRVKIRNASSDARRAYLFVNIWPGENLSVKDGALCADGRVIIGDTVTNSWALQSYGEERLRAHIRTGGKGALKCLPAPELGIEIPSRSHFEREMYDEASKPAKPSLSSAASDTLLYEIDLGPYEAHSIDIAIPYPTYVADTDLRRIAALDFNEEQRKVTAFWRGFYEKAARLSLPGEDRLNDFVKAVPWHVAMSAARDPASGYYTVPAATYAYQACGNEACFQIRMLDYLGRHDYAEKYLDAYIRGQGTLFPDGNFKSADGAMVAVNFGNKRDMSSHFAYNLDHGYILSCFADHYRLTGDAEWLKKAAPALVRACDFVFRERKATMIADEKGRKASYYGLLPHGHLEDNPEWRCWFAVNAHAYGGVLRVGEALREIGHPEAGRILDEGLKYRADIRVAIKQAMAGSPAVPSGRGGHIPHIPTRAEIRGRDWGWIRETMYGPLHFVYGLALDPNEQMTGWILNDLEDNLFLSRNYGRIADREKHWFSRGGITIQSNLLFNDLAYLERGEPERALRALFNNFAQNLYRDMNCFTEHPVPEFGRGAGPFFKTPDESQFIVLLRNHLVRETENGLNLLEGASRGWFGGGKKIEFEGFATAYGPVSFRTASSGTDITIEAEIKGEWRKTPEELNLYLRRPDKKTPVRVLVNGIAAEAFGEKITVPSPARVVTVRAEYEI